ncbi:MAG: hypothetical protein H0V82_06695 [Candidatus Protochlamydia sp.]|nr:hypothetical protein [Candidatus Protochlamydia sp.]
MNIKEFQALMAPENMSDVFLKHFGLENGVDLDILDQRSPHNPMNFD